MKALFIRCYGVLTPDMLVGGLIDMGVPPAYLKARLEQAGAPAVFIEKANDKAQFGAHYFHIPGGEGPVSAASLREEWDALCSCSGASFAAAGQRVLALLGSGADLAPLRVRQADARSLFCFLAGVEYLDAEAVYTCPFELGHGTDEGGALTEQILVRAGSTAGLPIPADGITPFAAAMLEGLSTDFTPIDGRFLLDRTSYGSASSESPDGDNTAALYLGYFTERRDSLFSRQMKVFGGPRELFE